MSDDVYDIGDLQEEISPPPRKGLPRWLKGLFIFFFLLVCTALIAGFGAYLLYDHITQPRRGGEIVEFTVPEGATGNEVAQRLQEEGLIEHEVFFQIALRLAPSTSTIRHGVFELPKGESALQLLTRLRTDRAQLSAGESFKVTIPEGLTLAQMASTREEASVFLAAVKAIDTLHEFSVSVSTPEGFLMPNTYFFPQPPTETELVQRMVSQFKKDYANLMERYPDKVTEDPVVVLTIASLIEEEARLDEERALVSAVIHNRLQRNMRLEMDSTLQYSLKKYGQRLLNSDKEVDSPYNTYLHRGLPPGPISNPGVKSIEAALNPAEVDYIFFVSNADGNSHTFTSTLNDHNKAVAQFRRDIKTQRNR